MSEQRELYLESVIAAWEVVARKKDEIIDQLFEMLEPTKEQCRCIKCELKRAGKWKLSSGC